MSTVSHGAERPLTLEQTHMFQISIELLRNLIRNKASAMKICSNENHQLFISAYYKYILNAK